MALCVFLRRLNGGVRKERKDKGQKHASPEEKVQVACVAWGEEQGLLIDGSPGGAAFRKGAHTAHGCKPGRADLLVLEPGADGSHGLAVELKVVYRNGKQNELSDAQAAWLQRARCKGWRTAVAYSLVEFRAVVRVHMGGSSGAPVGL